MHTTTVDDPSAVHACAVPGSDEQLWETTARFLGDGLAAGERVVYFADGTADAVLERLVDDRVAVDRLLADGQLTVVDTDGTRAALRRTVREAAAALAALVDDAADAGYAGLRMTGQFSHGLLRPGGTSLADHDRIIDPVLAGRRGRVLCLYDRHRFPDDAIERMRALHRVEIETPTLYDDGLLRVTRVDRFRLRAAGEVDHSNRPVIARMIAAALDDALRSDGAPAALALDLSSLRFLDVAGAVALVHAAEEFPEAHRLALTGVRPGVLRAHDRCGAPFAAQLDLDPHPGVGTGFRCPATQGGRAARIPASRPAAPHPEPHPRLAPPAARQPDDEWVAPA